MLKWNRVLAFTITGGFLFNSGFALAHSPIGAPEETFAAGEILNKASNLRGEITRQLEDPVFVAELRKLGIQKSEVHSRLAAMTDVELQQVQQGVERQAGGEAVVVVSVTTLLIGIILILLLAR